jgi:hypothetical protein
VHTKLLLLLLLQWRQRNSCSERMHLVCTQHDEAPHAAAAAAAASATASNSGAAGIYTNLYVLC